MIGIVLAVLVIAGLLLNGLRLRGRIAALPQLPPAGDAAEPPADEDYRAIVAEHLTLDDATLRDAVAYASREGLQVVDLVPADLPMTAARDLASKVTPPDARGPGNGLGPGSALLVATKVLERAQVTDPGTPSTADLIGMAQRLKNYVPEHTALVVAPALRAGSDDLSRRPARLRAALVSAPIAAVFSIVPYLLLAGALAKASVWGVAGLVVLLLQPYLIFAGTGISPRGLHLAALLRPLHDVYVWVRTASGRWRSTTERHNDTLIAEAREYYAEELAKGIDRFFEPRRETCPWCGSGTLHKRLRSKELVQHKPGTFTLDQCDDCGHTFQNPRLTPEGLGFYYRDFYDGVRAATHGERAFSAPGNEHVPRAKMPESHVTPKNWLDVGSGHAHFCSIARKYWPDTVFDGLDQSAGIEEGARRGWITNAYRGSFLELADQIQGRYDIISMHHYLEHTAEPLAELDVVAKVLPPGGHVQIELPDPEWPLIKPFGQYWMPWFQPQHLHMMPIGNLKKALEERGLTPIAEERKEAHQTSDFVGATYLFLARLAPDPKPWSAKPQRGPLGRMWHSVVWLTGLPLLVGGIILDKTLTRFVARTTGIGNTYRVLARKNAD